MPDKPSSADSKQQNEEQQPNEPANEDEEQKPKTHLEDSSVSQVKKADELIELEECVKAETGVWVFFNKLLPKEDDEAHDTKKKGKGKSAAVEEEKPVYGRAWLDLSSLKDPGETKVEARIFLETAEFHKPKTEEEQAEKDQKDAAEEDNEEPPKVFEEAETYIMCKLEINEPIIPSEEDFVHQALPHDLIEPKSVAQSKIKPMKDPEGDFKKQLKLAIESINKVYLNMFEEDLKREGIGGCSDETFEARKEQFLYDFNISGKYHIMKEKFKKTVVKIVRETFKKKKAFKGLHMDEQDHFYSILYAHLVNQIQGCIKDMVETRKDVLHENVLISDKKEAQKEIDTLIDSHTHETEDERLARLCEEYEELGELDKAHSYMETRAKLNPDSIQLWRSYALFMLRNYGHFDKAQE